MSRLHVHIAVEDIEENVRFYSALFDNSPTVRKADYVKWELANPPVNFAISTRGAQAGLDHVGLQADSDEELHAIQARLEQAGIAGREQRDAACCYAKSDKYWTTDPQGIAWESFHTLESIPTFNTADSAGAKRGCCVPDTGSGCC